MKRLKKRKLKGKGERAGKLKEGKEEGEENKRRERRKKRGRGEEER